MVLCHTIFTLKIKSITIFRKLFLKLIKPLPLSNAQAGEDRILDFLFTTIGLKKITYIDIGANHPILFNNTYLLYAKGSRGILIEPDPVFGKSLQKARRGDTVIQAAISDKESGEADFYIFDEPSLNTLSRQEATLRQQSGKFHLKEVRKIQLLTIGNIIADYLKNTLPHLISLDVEGVDYAVLDAFSFSKYPVPVWIIETCEYSESHIKPKIENIITLMKNKGYFIYADTYVNTIFVNADWFYNYGKKSAVTI